MGGKVGTVTADDMADMLENAKPQSRRMIHATEGRSEDPHSFWITTYSKHKFYPRDPEGSVLRIEDIAHALSNLCRFGGRCRRFYSVAEHSIMVSQLSDPEDALWGLLHDASEAYLVDIPRPIKHLPEMKGYRDLEARVQAAIIKTFGLPPGEPTSVKRADQLALRTEAKDLGLLNPDWDIYDLPDVGSRIVPLDPPLAESAFLTHFKTLRTRDGR